MKRFVTFSLLMLTVATAAVAQTTLTRNELRAVADRCAPSVPFETILAITRTESGLYPYAISLNYPARAAARAGLHGRELTLGRQPRNQAEALHWLHWFQQRHYTVSVGLMQINIENARFLGFTPEELFQPCANVAVGSWLLKRYFTSAFPVYKDQNKALLAAFSAYNSGSFTHGINNGYVHRVLKNARYSRPASKPVPTRERTLKAQE